MPDDKGPEIIKALPTDERATSEDFVFIDKAYEVARNSVANGNHPFSAILVKDGKIIMEIENEVVTTSDVTRHAETLLVSKATRRFDQKILSESTLYASTEPCVMCCGAIHWAGIPKIVFGVKGSHMAESLGEPYMGIPSVDFFERLNPHVVVVGPVLEKQGLQIHLDFWPKFNRDQKN